MVIVASGFLFVHLTAAPEVKLADAVPVKDPNAPIDVIRAKFYVTLSRAGSVTLFANAGYYKLASEKGTTVSDYLKIAKDNPVLEIKVDWLEESGFPGFAKVVVEAPGRETFTHVFEAPGDIDDFVELPF